MFAQRLPAKVNELLYGALNTTEGIISSWNSFNSNLYMSYFLERNDTVSNLLYAMYQQLPPNL